MKEFQDRVHNALQDETLRSNFRHVMDELIEKRKAILPEPLEWENLRDHGQAIRQKALNQLPELLEKLEKQCIANRIQVHWAENQEQGNQIVGEILQHNQVICIVKGKSFVTEEMHLNDFLEERGIECLESDLGEFIIQLDREPPSHIIAPAIHKNVQGIAQQFAEKLKLEEYTEDVTKLIQIARKVLREKFYTAEAGITGVNFAVAETGTLCLVENEGNGRFSTTLPPIHIAVMGIEKVVEKLEEIPPLLSLLTRSATGQPITTYFNMITSPRKQGEKDGPEQVHLVLLDNGRSQMYQNPELRQTLQCIRCGACLNHCPIYTRIGGHAYGTTIPGPIGKILMPQLRGLEAQGHLPGVSTLCGACEEVCPVKIPIPKLLLRLRKNVQEKEEGKPHQKQTERWMWEGWQSVYAHPQLWKAQRKVLGWTGRGMLAKFPPLQNWAQRRTLPKIARTSLHDLVKKHGVEEE